MVADIAGAAAPQNSVNAGVIAKLCIFQGCPQRSLMSPNLRHGFSVGVARERTMSQNMEAVPYGRKTQNVPNVQEVHIL